MTRTDLTRSSAARLADSLESLASAFGDTVGTLVDRNLRVGQGRLELLPMTDLLEELQRPVAVLRSMFGAEFGGKPLLVLIEVQDAAALAGLLLMTRDEEIENHRKQEVLEGQDREAMKEIGLVLSERLDRVLHEAAGRPAELRFKDHTVIDRGSGQPEPTELTEVVCYRFEVGFAEYPEMSIRVLLDPDTAVVINGGSITDADPHGERDEGLRSIPQAPIQGKLDAYLCSTEPFAVLRRSCRRVGLELQRHPAGEVPNPAAHKNGIVLMEIPPGEERRFDWCKRLKDFEANIKVVLIIHRPSRARVLQGFIAEADVILGWPVEEAQLSQKLTGLLHRETVHTEQD